MAVEQIRPDSRAEQGGRLKTQDLNVGAGTAILFKIPRRAADSFISMPRYIQNEGMPEPSWPDRANYQTFDLQHAGTDANRPKSTRSGRLTPARKRLLWRRSGFRARVTPAPSTVPPTTPSKTSCRQRPCWKMKTCARSPSWLPAGSATG